MAGWVAVDADAVASRWRPLTTSESAIVDTLIEDAQDILEGALEDSGVTGKPEPTDERWERAYVRVVANMVRRLLINPEGYLEEEGPDGYRYRRDKTLSAGVLYVTDDELDRLLPRRRRGASFSIFPS
ncbi:MAG: Gp19/Gp15/Gp42 family protein [Pseudolysinimonas sp.]